MCLLINHRISFLKCAINIVFIELTILGGSHGGISYGVKFSCEASTTKWALAPCGPVTKRPTRFRHIGQQRFDTPMILLKLCFKA